MGLEQRRQLKWSFARKRTKIWPVEMDMWEPNRYCLIGKKFVFLETHSARAGTWIQPLAVSLTALKSNCGLRWRLEGSRCSPVKFPAVTPSHWIPHITVRMWKARARMRRLKGGKKKKLTQVPGIWYQKTGTRRDSVFGVVCAWSSPLFSEAMHWNKKWSRFLFQAFPDARTPVTLRDAKLKRLRNPPPCEIHGPPAQVEMLMAKL